MACYLFARGERVEVEALGLRLGDEIILFAEADRCGRRGARRWGERLRDHSPEFEDAAAFPARLSRSEYRR